jgi:hypothetical protein
MIARQLLKRLVPNASKSPDSDGKKFQINLAKLLVNNDLRDSCQHESAQIIDLKELIRKVFNAEHLAQLIPTKTLAGCQRSRPLRLGAEDICLSLAGTMKK